MLTTNFEIISQTHQITMSVIIMLETYINTYTDAVFDFYAGPSARGRQLYCWACNFKNVSALLAGSFFTSYIDPNRLPLLRDTDTKRFYSKDIHLVMIQTITSERWQNCINRTRDVNIVSTELEMSKLYQLFPQRK